MTPRIPDGRRVIAVVAYAHEHGANAVAIGIVVHETEARRWSGPIVGRIAELHAEVPVRDAMMLAALRALEVARDRGATVVKVRGTFARHQRGHVAQLIGTVGSSNIGARLRQAVSDFDLARMQWCARSKTLEPRVLARAALPISRARAERIPSVRDSWEPWDGEDAVGHDLPRDEDIPF